jgi:four helix bundle protein
MENDLLKRLFKFAVDTIKFLRTLPKSPETSIIRYQLTKSSCSSGANYEESQAGCSRADFMHKVSISLKEMRESNYWYRIIDALQFENIDMDELKRLLNKSEELKKILGSIVLKA